ncbi:SMP-30/gluconolactonase/LRE family protein [Hymenobacter siberiensis]|uniref:hypothetical protein n=1 Tax=Hymenobacter siberiensis TaxID=2848396 RepID=UPI001C1E2DCA|nr:hypothetical protein [Hymenobacter siberiensis]
MNKEAVVNADSATLKTASADTMGVPAGSIPTIGSPQLLFTLLDTHNTPDGLARSPDGRILLSVPNIADNSQPAAIIEIVGNAYQPFAPNLPLEPITKKAAPMDLAFGPDGNVYYTENQYENSKKFVSRLMRINMKNGKPGNIETVVDSFALSNGLVWKGNLLYITDSQWDMPGNDKGSAILRFTLDELKRSNGPLHLKPKTKDPHVLAMFTTNERNRRGQRGRRHRLRQQRQPLHRSLRRRQLLQSHPQARLHLRQAGSRATDRRQNYLHRRLRD